MKFSVFQRGWLLLIFFTLKDSHGLMMSID